MSAPSLHIRLPKEIIPLRLPKEIIPLECDIPPFACGVVVPSYKTLFIGREKSNTHDTNRSINVTLPHGQVSRQHCKFSAITAWEVMDLGSKNGTKLNGTSLAKVNKCFQLTTGDQITVATYTMSVTILEGRNIPAFGFEFYAVYALEEGLYLFVCKNKHQQMTTAMITTDAHKGDNMPDIRECNGRLIQNLSFILENCYEQTELPPSLMSTLKTLVMSSCMTIGR